MSGLLAAVAVVIVTGSAVAATSLSSGAPTTQTVAPSFQMGSCPSPSFCAVVATIDVHDGIGSLWVEQPANSWSNVQDIPLGVSIDGVSCPASGWCMAVGAQPGHHFDRQPTETTFAEVVTRSGVHDVVPVPRLSSELQSVSCTSVSNCVAVGDQQQPFGESQTLAERWNGVGWSVMRPTAGIEDDQLTSVSCASSSSCVAVGYNVSGGRPVAEVLRSGIWRLDDGRAIGWHRFACSRRVGCPPIQIPPSFTTISCGSPTYCVAQGSLQLAEVWNDGVWRRIPAPLVPTSSYTRVAALSCVSHRCLAVGRYGRLPFADEWTGSRWINVSPRQEKMDDEGGSFISVDCSSASECVATGHANGVGSPSSSFLAVWRQGIWSFGSPVVKGASS
jgi:hypothetical protein